MGKIHKGSAWQSVRAQVLATADTCAICRKPLDQSGRYKAPHALSPSVDHIIPVTMGGAPYALDNLQPAHLGCNTKKGTTLPGRSAPLHTSRNW